MDHPLSLKTILIIILYIYYIYQSSNLNSSIKTFYSLSLSLTIVRQTIFKQGKPLAQEMNQRETEKSARTKNKQQKTQQR